MTPKRVPLWAAVTTVVFLTLAGCKQAAPQTPDDGPGQAESSTAAPEVSSTEYSAPDMPDEGKPVGYCGDVDAFDDKISVYLGDEAVTCGAAHDLMKRIQAGEGDDDEGGDGFTLGEWSCAYGPDHDPAAALKLLCWQGENKNHAVLLRPTGLDPLPGYHVNPLDFPGSDDQTYFTTPAGRFHCSLGEGQMGCDAHQGWPPGVPDVKDPDVGDMVEPTAIVLGTSGAARFEVFGDPTHTYYDDGSGFGENTPALGYGQVLVYHGFSCTADQDRGVVCKRGNHGFEISSRKYKVY